jgi:hypothetical protein
MRTDLFDLLRRVPEEQIRADGRTQHCDDCRQIAAREADRWLDDAQSYRLPVDRDHYKHHGHVREQRTCQPLQEACVALVGNENLQRERGGALTHEVKLNGSSEHELCISTHSCKIGGDIDRIRDGQHDYGGIEDGRRMVTAEICRESPVQ